MESLFKGLDLPEEVTKTLTERISTEIEAQKQGVKNDPEFIRGIKQAVAGEFFKKQEKTYKKVFPGLNLEDIEGEGTARMEAIAKAGVATLEQSKDATNQDLQKQLMDLTAEYQTYKEEQVPQLLQDQKQGFHTRYIDDAIFRDSSTIDTVCTAEARPAIVDAYVHRKGYKKVWNEEAGTYAFMTADNLTPTLDNKPLSNEDIIRTALDEAGVLQKSNGTPGEGGEGRKDQHAKPDGKLSSNAERMRQMLEQAD